MEVASRFFRLPCAEPKLPSPALMLVDGIDDAIEGGELKRSHFCHLKKRAEIIAMSMIFLMMVTDW